ncbi:hypothetical protein EWM64_g2780 [Hericium alpestre]|uniref:Uncharacterized protein n=1 Tax=Hericium alpestre TaxID=135208 RepID=A0A4Z0A4H9_9AGAM|nr:hypothetical protein EWM64_g2780 [Hericium alpestre]
MDDDIPTQQHEDVEVEMEPYHSDPIEYEMVDDGGVVAANIELVDVEFVDAPQDSDAAIAQPTDIPPYQPTPIPLEHGQADDHPHIVTELVSVVENTAGPHLEAGSTDFFDKPTPMPHEPTPYDHRPADVVEAPQAHQDPSDSTGPHTENAVNGGVAVVSATDESYHSPSQQGAVLPETLDSNDTQLGSAAAVVHPEYDSTSYDQATSAPEIPEDHETVTTDLTPADEPYLEEDLADVPEERVQREADSETHVTHDVSEATEGAESDPHEISEGVFIEPPPAVLLELPSSSEQPECCLFNVLDQAQGESTESERRRFEILLGHRPTLYYERLSDVFDALREEEMIQRLPELLESEMVLDAYDLQLAVSEDNIYAREVTLHDLNILHDGTDLTGPLRCRLRFIKPRFIERYHQLKDQIARLNVADEGGELYTDETVQHEDETHDAYYEQEQPDTVYEEAEGDTSVAQNEDVQAAPDEGEAQYEDGDTQYAEYEEVIDGEVPPDEEHEHEGTEAAREKAFDDTQGGVGDEVYEAPDANANEVTEEDVGPLEYEGEASVVPEEDYAPSQHEEEAYEETQDEYLGSVESSEVIDQTSLSRDESGVEPTDDAVAVERGLGEDDDALYEDDSYTVSSNHSEPVAVNPEDDRTETEDVAHPLTDDTEDKSPLPIAGSSHQPEHVSERHDDVDGSSHEIKPESETWDYQKPEDELWDEAFDDDDDDLALAEQPEDASTESATLSSKTSHKRDYDEADLQSDKLESDAQSDRLSQAASPEKRSRTR